ncbi:hypothetical protein ACPX19_07660 [Winogradskyella sp. HB-48]|uniref:hypothetical protein n=1 Tax=Winogradskyella sp. HB-48 TaxID=3416808 RepID=UPI003CEDADA6
MKKIFLSLIIFVLTYTCSTYKIENKSNRYFDDKNVEINKVEFKKKLSSLEYLGIEGDSINHRRLIKRENYGEISNKKVLLKLLKETVNSELDSTKPIVIIYYPGKDKCNSTGGFTSKLWVENWRHDLENGINQIAQVKPLYIYKTPEGLEKHKNIIKWYEDPENTIEKLFFKHHYPCGSFVVISKNGDYISYLGEYPKEYVWAATKLMNK